LPRMHNPNAEPHAARGPGHLFGFPLLPGCPRRYWSRSRASELIRSATEDAVEGRMTEDVWLASENLASMFPCVPGSVLSRKKILFSLTCARQVFGYGSDEFVNSFEEWSKEGGKVLDVMESHIDGTSSDESRTGRCTGPQRAGTFQAHLFHCRSWCSGGR